MNSINFKGLNLKGTKEFLLWLFPALCLFSLAGCAPTSGNWASMPEVQHAGNAYYDVQLTPLKNGHNFFTKFRLDVFNKRDKALKIQWDKTRYINNGRKQGPFVFKNIDPKDIKNQTVPDDVIAPGSHFSREIAPHVLVARSPMRTNTSDKGIMAGILPDGENGIYLVITHAGKEVTGEVTVVIEEGTAE